MIDFRKEILDDRIGKEFIFLEDGKKYLCKNVFRHNELRMFIMQHKQGDEVVDTFPLGCDDATFYMNFEEV